MQSIKNICVGFLVSYIGSLPMGYLNVIGLQIYTKNGIERTIEYLIGVIIIEAIVIYTTLLFANKLLKNDKWIKRIEIFTIAFLLFLGFSFLLSNDNLKIPQQTIYNNFLPFFTGLFLSTINFINIPFWAGWNLYLINNKYITTKKNTVLFYLFGTISGTLLGMLSLILTLNYFFKNFGIINGNILSKVFTLLFFILAIIQIGKFYFKYYRPVATGKSDSAPHSLQEPS